jgi:hypothetical protein
MTGLGVVNPPVADGVDRERALASNRDRDRDGERQPADVLYAGTAPGLRPE